MRRWNRSLVLGALVMFVLGSSAVGLATVENTARLVERDRGTSSKDLEPNDRYCPRQWKATEAAVVWKLTLTGDDDDLEDVKITDFGYHFEESRLDVSFTTRDEHIYVKTDQHATLLDAKAAFKSDDDDDDEWDDDEAPVLRLKGVCYSGAGPTPNVQIIFQADICADFGSVDGNQIDVDSSTWDETNGSWEDWGKVYRSNAPMVRAQSSPLSGCSWHNGQGFAMGTSNSMANYWRVPGATGKDGHGNLHVSSQKLPKAIRAALVDDTAEVWFARVSSTGNAVLGSFKCHDDSMHADNFEFITEAPANNSTLVCVAHSVSR